MTSNDIINYKKIGFDNDQYLQLQSQKIQDRINKFTNGKLYLEIGGKFLWDPHASRVLPGFRPNNKVIVLRHFIKKAEILFAINAIDIINNRPLLSTTISYIDETTHLLDDIEKKLGKKPLLVINLIKQEHLKDPVFNKGLTHFKRLGYKIFKRYFIKGYPNNLDTILGQEGFDRDDYIETNSSLIIVTGAASNSGKQSTCLGQIYLDKKHDLDSGYAKYETFPIWNLPLEHPVNLAYEAATADIGDYNVVDKYYQKAYGKLAINYNRDEDSFLLLKQLANKITNKNNYIRNYQSPTDMGINYAGFAITNDEIVCNASLQEIQRRRNWYNNLVKLGKGNQIWVDRCNKLEQSALKYMHEHEYRTDLKLS